MKLNLFVILLAMTILPSSVVFSETDEARIGRYVSDNKRSPTIVRFGSDCRIALISTGGYYGSDNLLVKITDFVNHKYDTLTTIYDYYNLVSTPDSGTVGVVRDFGRKLDLIKYDWVQKTTVNQPFWTDSMPGYWTILQYSTGLRFTDSTIILGNSDLVARIARLKPDHYAKQIWKSSNIFDPIFIRKSPDYFGIAYHSGDDGIDSSYVIRIDGRKYSVDTVFSSIGRISDLSFDASTGATYYKLSIGSPICRQLVRKDSSTTSIMWESKGLMYLHTYGLTGDSLFIVASVAKEGDIGHQEWLVLPK